VSSDIVPSEHHSSYPKIVGLPPKQGLYDPSFERDACGVGFVVNIKGKKSHEIVQQGLTILLNLDHRGARGSEFNTGDGAGILMQLPHKFFQKVCAQEGITLPAPGEYGVGMVFCPPDEADCGVCQARFEEIVKEEGQILLGWRRVVTDNSSLGETAKLGEPIVHQVFIAKNAETLADDPLAFERKLYVIRKRAEHAIRYNDNIPGARFYMPSLSARTIVYKGMLLPEQVPAYFRELDDPDVESALALVHSRFSTNTFPSWERAHPYRYIIHNGEINTLRGNVNWMYARQSTFESKLFGDDLGKILPVINNDGSDSAMFDEALEFLTLAGRPLHQVMMMMIPEPWSGHKTMDDAKKAFYEYHSTLMEPWDGPASIGFTDGTVIGATLDRNGLRPSRYYVTKDDLVIMASEVGVLDIPADRIQYKGRLQPGRMLLVDTAEGRIIADEEIKAKAAAEYPYREWLDKYLVNLKDLPTPPHVEGPDHETVLQRQQAFGYTFETLRVLVGPMAKDGVEPIGAMGNDTPLAVLSDKPQLLYNYFKQLFAQVTNPPIDAIREELVTASEVYMGTELNLLEVRPENCRQIKIKNPILTNEELAKIRYLQEPGFKSATLPMLFPIGAGAQGLEDALEEMYQKAKALLADGVNVLILSDRGVSADMAAIPALLATSGLHHFLIREELRTQAALIVESGEPREVHHFALLVGYGATAVNPYLSYETITDMVRQGMLTDIGEDAAVMKYIKASVKGVVKVLSKMGISTMQSYCGAQIFEALGLSQALVDKYFTWTPSRIEGIGLAEIYQEVAIRHRAAFPERQTNGHVLPAGGEYQWRSEGERHLFNPQTIHFLQRATRNNEYATFKKYSALVDDQSREMCTLRSLLEFKFAAEPIPLDEVESVESICKRFKTGAMSYGSISQEAHEALAIAMNRIGGRSNTGEGGEDPARYTPEPNGDSKNSAIKQVASGRFGVTSEYLVNAQELQIKMAQGAKPGEGGQLPGRKVYPWIARVRHSTPGVGLISPPPHHDIYSIEDLAELIHDLKNANPRARINVKLVSEVGVGTIAAGVAKGHADVILISGHDGGTGASPQTSIKHAGLPWELGLAETNQTLVLNNLRSRVRLETDGQLKTGRDLAIAVLLGAEEYGFATSPLVALGCIMMRVCHLDTCPVGVATQNPELRKKFTGDPQHVVNFMYFMAQELREYMAKLGFRTIDEMVGRTDVLEPRGNVDHWKARGIDLAQVLYRPDVPESVGRYCQMPQDHGLDKALDNTTLLKLAKPALERGEPVSATLPIRNINRVVGTILGSEVTRRYGRNGLPEDTILFRFQGSAGQSFGAFVPKGITLVLEGDGNDYFGKGLSGGKLIAYPADGATFVAEENSIIGNVALYGATDGEAFIRGVAGERFAVRNSGVTAVVEGVGDHGCEYMTGGRVVVLGQTGRNFAAGMSGGIAYVLDEAGSFAQRYNDEMVDLVALDNPAEIAELEGLIRRHGEYTASAVAARVLANWGEMASKFVKVYPRDYRRMQEVIAEVEAEGLTGEEALMAAFERNKSDVTRVSGN
jgi:glutamate synthase domain-containing protein 2/glutamate synthase domain-containing protein 1/glutamate synthase domain-containing protein 3